MKADFEGDRKRKATVWGKGKMQMESSIPITGSEKERKIMNSSVFRLSLLVSL
jgi:hypothetical protein